MAVAKPDAAADCWVITTGEAGMTNQAIGLAEAVGLPFKRFKLDLPAPWRWLPGWATPGVLSAVRTEPEGLHAPWPRLLISCGRRSTHVSVAIRRASGGRTLTVHVQDPQIDPVHFGLVVPPRHDGLKGANVLETTGAIHRITPDKLAAARERFAGTLSGDRRPLIGVLLGGNSRTVTYTTEMMQRLGRQLAQAVSEGAGTEGASPGGGRVLITPSRRTPAAGLRALSAALQGIDHWIWDGRGENPYFGLLALSDHLVVTGDSVSMVSEACATGRPVHVFEVPGVGRRLQRFHDDLKARGIARPFTGALPEWRYPPVNDTPRVAAEVHRLLEERARD